MKNCTAVLTAIIVVFVVMEKASAHHILGTPHYAYDEEYPQTPVLTYRTELGNYDVRMTGFPGMPQPGDRMSLHFYITRLDTGEPFSGTVTVTVFQERVLGEDPVIYGPMQGELEEAMFKFFPQFVEEANYIVRLEYVADGIPWGLDLEMAAGEPGSPWAVIGGIGLGLVLFFLVFRAIRIKWTQRARREVSSAPTPELDSTV